MKKICIFLLMLSFVTTFTTACTHKPKQSMVQSKRRFAQYVETQNNSTGARTVDLSEGPKLNYDAKMGPQTLNFDIKIVDPY